LGARYSVDAFAGMLAPTSIALTESQQDALIGLISNHELESQKENQARYNMVFSGPAPISSAEINAASSVLSTDQVAALRQFSQVQERAGELRFFLQTK
jgi:hypothetical protein